MVDIVVTGRHLTIPDEFRSHITDKLGKVEQLANRVQRIDVLVTHEPNPRQSKASERVEITCRARGQVVRAEARHDDKYAAFETAMDKLAEQLRRAADRRRVRRGRRAPESLAAAAAKRAPAPGDDLSPSSAAGIDVGADGSGVDTAADAFADSPIEVRVKVHASDPMSLEQALREMELVGHDFYLFHDTETDRPSVVYRRRGWSYGVLHLEPASADAQATGTES